MDKTIWVDNTDQVPRKCRRRGGVFALLGLQSRFGEELLGMYVVCPHNGTAVLNGFNVGPPM